VELIPVVLGTTVSVVLAYRGWGVVALVAGSGVQQLAWSAAVVTAAGVPSAPAAPMARVRPLIRFGASLSLFQILNTTARKLDDLLVGGLMGVAALGLYEKSYALMMVPVAYLAGAANRVMYPALAKVRDDPEQFRFLYLGAIRKVAGLSLPASAFCVAAAGPVVRGVLGPRFEAAIPIFSVLALMIGIQPLLAVSGTVYLAHARMRRYLTISTIASTVLILAFCIGAMRGTPGAMARWYTGAYCLVFVPQLHFVLRTAKVGWGEFLGRIAPTAFSAVAMLAAGRATGELGFVPQFAAMALTYVGIHLLLDRHALFDLFRFLDPRRVVVRIEPRPSQREVVEDVVAESRR
jgi:PST family polysaccharide transporter